MSRMRDLFTSAGGVNYTIEDGDRPGESVIIGRQDASALLSENRAMANHNDGYSPSRELRRVARIPLHLIHQWKVEEGWDAFDPDHADRLARKLNDPDYRYLRTAEGSVAPLADGGFR